MPSLHAANRHLLDRRMAAALTIAVAMHALALFAFDLPRSQSTADRIRVTLSVSPSASPVSTEVGAARDQTGDDTESQHGRTATAAAETRNTGRANARHGQRSGTDTTRLTQPENSAPDQQRTGTSRPGGIETGRSDTAPGATERIRSAHADPRAGYVAQWKRRVEAAGTRNFPAGALRADSGNRLTVEVTLQSDGRLAGARVVRSSGNPDLDTAALRILRDTGPYAPFPIELREQRETLTFAYVWRFVAGRKTHLSVQ